MEIAVVSIGSFDTQYSDYHIMRDVIIGLLERDHSVVLIQKQYYVNKGRGYRSERWCCQD